MINYKNDLSINPAKGSEATAYLSQVGELDRQIRVKKVRLEILRDALSLRTPVMSDMPKAPSPSLHSMEDRLCDILTLEDEIRVLERELVMLKAEMMGKIEKINDADLQLVLIQCFLNLQSNSQASRALHYSRGWLIKLKERAIVEMDIVLAQESGCGNG